MCACGTRFNKCVLLQCNINIYSLVWYSWWLCCTLVLSHFFGLALVSLQLDFSLSVSLSLALSPLFLQFIYRNIYICYCVLCFATRC